MGEEDNMIWMTGGGIYRWNIAVEGVRGVSNHTSVIVMPVYVYGMYLSWCGGVLACPVLVSQGVAL